MIEDLINKAREIAKFAYCPYSGFRVGCVVQAVSGKLYTGFNIENASYGLTICAERVAICNAMVGEHGLLLIDKICVVVDGKDEVMPCGACRQFMSEHSNEWTRIIIKGIGEFSIEQLLPKAFKFIK